MEEEQSNLLQQYDNVSPLNSSSTRFETFEEELSTQCEDKEIINKDQLPSCVDEFHGVVCNCNHHHISNSIVTATTSNDKKRDD